MAMIDRVGGPGDAPASESKPSKLTLWSLGGLALSLFGGVTLFELSPTIAVHFQGGTSQTPAHTPDQALWDRLGLTVEDGPGGPTITKVGTPADSAHLKPGMRIAAIAAGLLSDRKGAGSILPAERVESVKRAEEVVRRAIAAGESRGLEGMRVEIEAWMEGRLVDLLSFGIVLNKGLPVR